MVVQIHHEQLFFSNKEKPSLTRNWTQDLLKFTNSAILLSLIDKEWYFFAQKTSNFECFVNHIRFLDFCILGILKNVVSFWLGGGLDCLQDILDAAHTPAF